MNSRTRTFKTLGCLAAAMTFTSMLLGWMDPSSPDIADRRSLHVILDDARRAVAGDVALVRGRWHSVEVLAGRVVDGTGTYLTATSQPTSMHHFEIDPAGNVHRTTDWVDQVAQPGAEGSVRIHMLRRKADEPMSRAQWDCVRALVTALRESRTGDNESFPVHFDNTWVAIYGLQPDNVIEVGPLMVSTR